MGSRQSTANQTARSAFAPGMSSSLKRHIVAEMQPPPKDNEDDQILDIESKVQMFKITVDKISRSKKKNMNRSKQDKRVDSASR